MRSGLAPHFLTLQRNFDCSGKILVCVVMPCLPINLCGSTQTSRPHLHLTQITSRRCRSSKVGSTVVRRGMPHLHYLTSPNPGRYFAQSASVSRMAKMTQRSTSSLAASAVA